MSDLLFLEAQHFYFCVLFAGFQQDNISQDRLPGKERTQKVPITSQPQPYNSVPGLSVTGVVYKSNVFIILHPRSMRSAYEARKKRLCTEKLIVRLPFTSNISISGPIANTWPASSTHTQQGQDSRCISLINFCLRHWIPITFPHGHHENVLYFTERAAPPHFYPAPVLTFATHSPTHLRSKRLWGRVPPSRPPPWKPCQGTTVGISGPGGP